MIVDCTAAPYYRWTFSENTHDRFRWQGYESSDEGLTRVRGEEIIGRRAA